MSEAPNTPAPPESPPPRFGWPLRVLLVLVLFHMFFRSTDIFYPWSDWIYELKIQRMPRALPTRAKLAELCAAAGGTYQPALREFQECAASLPRYLCPWPEEKTRAELTSATAWVKFVLAWTASRLAWCERILAIDQEWAMFSPNVGKCKHPTRARLFFADGSEQTLRMRCEPEDLTCYSRWDQGKNLGIDPRIAVDNGSRWTACPGYCNYLLHRHAHNNKGSPLVEIRFYQVTFNFAPPDADPVAYYRELMEQTRDHDAPLAWPAFYIYNVERRTGDFVPGSK